MSFGERMKQIRQNKGMTQNQLAVKANISRVAIGNYERGDRQPNIDITKKIADALGVPVADLAGWSAFDDQYPFLADEVKLLNLAKKIDENTFQLNELFLQLNDSGKAKAIDALSDLVMIEKYTKEK